MFKNDLSFEKNYFNGKMGIKLRDARNNRSLPEEDKLLKSIVMNGKIFVTN
jgi:hypothetical protein